MERSVNTTKNIRVSTKQDKVQITINETQFYYAKYLNCLGRMIKKDAMCTRNIKFSIAIALPQCSKRRRISLTINNKIHLKKTLIKCLIWRIVSAVLNFAHLEKLIRNTLTFLSEIWCWRRMDIIGLSM
jgi:hypothetical protein